MSSDDHRQRKEDRFKMKKSYSKGPVSPPLWNTTLGSLTTSQAAKYSSRDAVIVPWQKARSSYNDLDKASRRVAEALLSAGLKHGDTVGIVAGNRLEYIEVLLGTARVGVISVVLNNTYTPTELKAAVQQADCKIVFIAATIGTRNLEGHISVLHGMSSSSTGTCRIVIIGDRVAPHSSDTSIYNNFLNQAQPDSVQLQAAEAKVQPSDLMNLQFTSGTTGSPKAAMLTHNNLINDARFIGDGMQLTEADKICCPPPLYHCFGLVIGFLAAFTHGSSIVFPSDQFDAVAVLDAVESEKCTALHGVPTMFIAELEENRKRPRKLNTLRTGVAAGSAVPAALLKRLEKDMSITGLLINYGMTETSPVTFMTAIDDTKERKLRTLGRVLPHTIAKIIDTKGQIVPCGVPGELCTSGFALQTGYWKNQAKTDEVMIRDEEGVLWMHTGDECVLDEEGYCMIVGRIKDVIIRGGENIFPLEIEERLLKHAAIADASVIGVKDERYGEVVGAFLKQQTNQQRPSLEDIRIWVLQVLGKHKAPVHVFWLGDPGVGEDFPKTGSGKHQKHIMRAMTERVLKRDQRARL